MATLDTKGPSAPSTFSVSIPIHLDAIICHVSLKRGECRKWPTFDTHGWVFNHLKKFRVSNVAHFRHSWVGIQPCEKVSSVECGPLSTLMGIQPLPKVLSVECGPLSTLMGIPHGYSTTTKGFECRMWPAFDTHGYSTTAKGFECRMWPAFDTHGYSTTTKGFECRMWPAFDTHGYSTI